MGGQVYQTLASWQSACGLRISCALFSGGRFDSSCMDVSKIYLDAAALASIGYNMEFSESCEKPYVRLLDCLVQYPASDLARELLGAFFANLSHLQTIQLAEQDPTAPIAACLNLKDIKEDDDRAAADVKIKLNVESDEELSDEENFVRNNLSEDVECDEDTDYAPVPDKEESDTTSDRTLRSKRTVTKRGRPLGRLNRRNKRRRVASDDSGDFDAAVDGGESCEPQQRRLDGKPISCGGRFVCKKCKARHDSAETLRDHVISVHDALSAGTLICPTCGLMFKNDKCRIEHEKRIHNTVVSASPKKKEIRDRNLPNGGAARVVCPTCGFECCTKWVLENHIKKWHENAFSQPRICELCIKPDSSNFSRRKYHTPYALEKHKSEYHGEECQSIICEHCSEVFKGGANQAKRSLRAHIDKVHLGIKHECDQCDKQFLTEKTLASHKRHVHRKEGKYPCKECGKVFGYYLQAVEHAYKDRGEAPHQCKFCDFKSAHSWALAKHRPVCKFRVMPRDDSDVKVQMPEDFGAKLVVRDFLQHRLNV